MIVPVRDGGEQFERCLAALWGQEAGLLSYEVIVVDNGSLEDTRRRAAPFPGTVLLHEPRPSSYAARNAGLAAARGRVFAFTDADARPRSDWLRRGVEAASREGGPWIIAGRVEVTLPERPNLFQLYDRLHNFLQERYVREGGYGVTANLFVDRRLVERAGLFSEDWVSGADVEFCRRACRSGGRIAYCAEAVVEHPPRSTFREFREKKIRVGRGLARLAAMSAAQPSVRDPRKQGATAGETPVATRLGAPPPGSTVGPGSLPPAASLWRVILGLPLLLWPGVHAFRPRFHGGLRLSLRQTAGLQLLHWLGKLYLWRGRLEEAVLSGEVPRAPHRQA